MRARLRLRSTIGAIALVCAAPLLMRAQPAQAPSPAQPQAQAAAAPAQTGRDHAVIRRDTYGVPHILADNEESAARAHGYATAEDHFDVLARLWVRARAEQARYFGEKFVDDDFEMLQLDIPARAAQQLGQLPPLTQALLRGYADGYNRYLATRGREAPAWATPITPADVLAHCYAVLLLDFSSIDRQALRRATAPAAATTTSQSSGADAAGDAAAEAASDASGVALAPFADQIGSNMWALGKSRTRSGHGILLANPHLRWSGSHLFHEVQITVPGHINVAGATLIGFPVVGIGFNEYGGWAHTVNTRDADDLYELTIDPNDPQRYLYDGLSLPLTRRTLSVVVKRASGGEETVSREVWSSHYGPVVRRDRGKAYALKSANVTTFDFLTEWHLMARAKSLDEFWEALRIGGLPMFNVAYTDRAGHVAYLFNGRIPHRPSGYDWAGTVPGDTSASEWYRLHAAGELPQSIDPPGGYVQNCNDAPWFVNLRRPIDRAKFPPYLTRDALGLRGQFSLRTLDAPGTFTLEAIKALKWNDRQLLADRVKPELLALVAKAPDARTLAPAAAVLARWDNRANADSKGAVLFQRWWDEYARKAKPIYRVEWSAAAMLTTPRGLGDPAAALAALQVAADAVQKEQGALDAPWGAVYRIQRGPKDWPASGAVNSFRTLGYQRGQDGRQVAAFGDSYVLAVEFTESPTAFSVLAYSQSTDAASPHFADQTALYAGSQFKPLWFTEADIARHTERKYAPD